MILVVGNIKGGVGKTTLAVNIAIARALVGKDVLLVDGDEQGSASIFTRIRNLDVSLNNAKYTLSRLVGVEVRTEVLKQKEKYYDIIIDVGGRNTDSLRAALTVADKVVIPVQPRSLDIWAIAETAKLIEEARCVGDIKAFSMLNLADSQGRDNDEAEDYLREFKGIDLLSSRIGRRKVFSNAVATGKSILEYLPRDEKAIKELNDLVYTIYTR